MKLDFLFNLLLILVVVFKEKKKEKELREHISANHIL